MAELFSVLEISQRQDSRAEKRLHSFVEQFFTLCPSTSHCTDHVIDRFILSFSGVIFSDVFKCRRQSKWV